MTIKYITMPTIQHEISIYIIVTVNSAAHRRQLNLLQSLQQRDILPDINKLRYVAFRC